MAVPDGRSHNQPARIPPQNDTFVINGVPFSGTGFGFDSTTGTMNLGYDSTQTPPKLVLGGDDRRPLP